MSHTRQNLSWWPSYSPGNTHTPSLFHSQNYMGFKKKKGVIIKIRLNGLRQCYVILCTETRYLTDETNWCLNHKQGWFSRQAQWGLLSGPLAFEHFCSPSEYSILLSMHFLCLATFCTILKNRAQMSHLPSNNSQYSYTEMGAPTLRYNGLCDPWEVEQRLLYFSCAWQWWRFHVLDILWVSFGKLPFPQGQSYRLAKTYLLSALGMARLSYQVSASHIQAPSLMLGGHVFQVRSTEHGKVFARGF